MTFEPTIPAMTHDPITTKPAPAYVPITHTIFIERDGSIGSYYVRQTDNCKCVNRHGNKYKSVVVSGHGVNQRWDVGELYPVSFQVNCYTLTASQSSAVEASDGTRGTNGKLHVSPPPQQPPGK